jgi:hypothetical protein
MAEGQRFELWNQLSPVTPLAGERLRPLGQPSVFYKIVNDKIQAPYTPKKNILQEIGGGSSYLIVAVNISNS